MSELSELGNRVLREAGFEVFVHAGWRPDLNDWMKDEGCYIRALHNLRPGSFGYSCRYGYFGSGIDTGKLIPVIPGYELTINAPNAKPVRLANKGPKPPRQIYDRLLGESKDEQFDTGKKTKKIIEVPAKGFLGKLGLTNREEIDKPVMETRKLYSPVGVGRILGTNSDEPAYLLLFALDKEIREGGQNPRPGHHPEISVISGKALAEDLISYALRNPQEYYNLLRSFIPEGQFPNVHRGILSPPTITNPDMDGKNYNGVEACGLFSI